MTAGAPRYPSIEAHSVCHEPLAISKLRRS